MSVFGDFLESVKELRDERDKTVKIRKTLYDMLIEEAGGEEDAELLLNKILADELESKREKKIKQEERLLVNNSLVDDYKKLEEYLHATLNRDISIGITNDLIGKERIYTLVEYKISEDTKSLRLKLRNNDEFYPISFHNIEDIKWNENDRTLKTWIYMKHPLPTWRFYLYYDQKVLDEQNKQINL